MKIDLECNRCGGELEFTVFNGGISIFPCDSCLRDEFEKGDANGYDIGFRDGKCANE